MAPNKKVATDFEEIIEAGRERNRSEKLAAQIFGKGRASSNPPRATVGGSLASRAGVKKRVASAAPRASTGNVNSEWTHDLHDSHASSGPAAAPNSLAARITNPNAPSQAGARGRRQQLRQSARLAHAIDRTQPQPEPARVASGNTAAAPPTAPAAFRRGLTIRGLAGPFVIRAQNFAPGTTAADIESAVTPVGGIVQRCRLLKTSPIVVAEIVLESKEGADNVIATFDKQTADGRVLSVYYPPALSQPAPPTGPRADRVDNDDMVIDGSMGFDDPMESDNSGTRRTAATGRGGRGAGNGGLYSDGLIRGNRRGRGHGRGGRGR